MADVLTGADDTATGCIKGLNMRNFNPCFRMNQGPGKIMQIISG